MCSTRNVSHFIHMIVIGISGITFYLTYLLLNDKMFDFEAMVNILRVIYIMIFKVVSVVQHSVTVETLSSCCIGNRGCHVRTLAKTQGPILMNKKQLMQDMVPFSICLGSSFSLWENPVNYLPNF